MWFVMRWSFNSPWLSAKKPHSWQLIHFLPALLWNFLKLLRSCLLLPVTLWVSVFLSGSWIFFMWRYRLFWKEVAKLQYLHLLLLIPKCISLCSFILLEKGVENWHSPHLNLANGMLLVGKSPYILVVFETFAEVLSSRCFFDMWLWMRGNLEFFILQSWL